MAALEQATSWQMIYDMQIGGDLLRLLHALLKLKLTSCVVCGAQVSSSSSAVSALRLFPWEFKVHFDV